MTLSAFLFIGCSLAIGGLFLAQPKAQPMGASTLFAGLALCAAMVLGIALSPMEANQPVRLDLIGVTKSLAGENPSLTVGTDARTADIVVPAYRGASGERAGSEGGEDSATPAAAATSLVTITPNAGGATIALATLPLERGTTFDACFHPVGEAFDQALCEIGTTKQLTPATADPVGIQLYRKEPGPKNTFRYRIRRGLTASLIPSDANQIPQIKVTFNDRPVADIGSCRAGTVGLRLASGPAAAASGDFAFPQIGAALLDSGSATALPFDTTACRFQESAEGSEVRLVRDSQTKLSIGNRDAPAAEILLRGRVLDYPLPAIALFVFAAGFAALRTIVLSGDRRDGANLDGPVTLLLFYLLGIRLLAALAAIQYDVTEIDPSGIVAQASVEILMVPLLLAAVLRIGRDAMAESLNDICFYALMAAGLWWLSVAPWQLLIGGGVLVALVGLAVPSLLPAIRTGGGRTGGMVAAVRARWSALPAPSWLRAVGPWLIVAAVLLLALRIVMAAFSIKEALPIPGVRIALSSLVLPFMILGCAALLARIDPPIWFGRRMLTVAIAAFWLFLFLIMLGAAAARDIGFTLVYFWPVAIVGVLLMLEWRRRLGFSTGQTALAFAPLPSAAVVLALTGLAVAAWTAAMTDSPILADRLQPALLLDANMSRLLAIFAPDRIEAASNTEAFQTLELVLRLNQLADNNLFGNGYLKDIDLGLMRSVQLSDNMPAVHLIWPFGRIGAAAMLLLLSLFGVAVRRQIGPLGKAQGTLTIAAHIAVWLLVGAAVYMVLANLLLVPFTGRNIFLLSASSWSDLVEGLTLILLIALPLQWRRLSNG